LSEKWSDRMTSSNFHMTTVPQISRAIRVTAFALLSLIVAGYAGLIALGRWQLDEYKEFYDMRSIPLYENLIRRLMWSPRPVTEPLYLLYGWAVNHFHHPFIVPLLGILWLIFLAAAFFTFRQKLKENARSVWPGALIALALVALSLAGGDSTEVFYWPAGSIAYMPALSATMLLFWQIVDGRINSTKGRMLAGFCLAIAAGSCEAGATFVVCYVLVQVFQRIRESWVKRASPNRRPLLWCAIPFLVASAVLLVVRTNRFYTQELAPEGNKISGHLIMSIVASFKEIAYEMLGRGMLARIYHAYPDPHTWLHSDAPLEMLLGTRIWMELLLLISVVLLRSDADRVPQHIVRQILELAIAFLAAALLTIAAANLHFGATCCERHELLRESWLEMILVGLAITCSAWFSDSLRQHLRRFHFLAPLLLVLSVLSLGCVVPLIRTYRVYALLRETTDQNSRSGFKQDRDSMSFTVLPSTAVISEEAIPVGTYTKPAEISGFSQNLYPYYLLGFYDKQKIEIQTLHVPDELPAVSVK
jgi:hypothetical protein